MDSRSGSDSRCSRPENAPYTWTYTYDSEHERVKELDDWLENLAPFDRDHYLGQLDGLFEDAAAGKVVDVGDSKTPIKPVRMDPDLFELRHQVLKRKLRFYHGEPEKHPQHLVRLHKHIKRTQQDGNATREISKQDQDEQMDFAVARYRGNS